MEGVNYPTEASLQENPTFDKEKAIEELCRGRELTDRLKRLVDYELETEMSDGSMTRDDLLGEILNSFTNTLGMLRCMESEGQLVFSQTPEESGESTIKSPTTIRDRRGKRRKFGQTSTREDSPTAFKDGHPWRKYGQKSILGAQFNRCYYRCTHKYDQECKATKHIEQIQDDPPAFRTTYYGFHTCRNDASQNLVIHSPPSSILLSFGSKEEDSSFILPNQAGNEYKAEAAHEPFVFSETALDSCTASTSAQSFDFIDSFDIIDAPRFDYS